MGFHNHGPVVPSKRHKQTVQKLIDLCTEYEGSEIVKGIRAEERADYDAGKTDLAP